MMIRTILGFLPLLTCLGARVTLFTQSCCLKAQVEGVTYNLNNATNITHSVFCPSSCVYQLSGSNNNSEVFCFDTVNNNTLCVAPTQKNERTGRFLRPDNATSKNNVRGPRNQGGIAGYVYEHAYYKGWKGWVGTGKNNFASSWNDYISSLKVNPGCKMTMYEHFNQQGAGVTFIENTPWVGNYWNDKFSSSECSCGVGSTLDWDHCTSSHPCDEGRGDCDSDNHCKPGLTCGRQDNCRFYFSQANPYADCCIAEHLAVKKQTLLDKCNYSAMKLGGTCTLVKLVDGSYHDAGTYQTGYITSCVRITKSYVSCPTIEFLTKLGLMHINTDEHAKNFEAVDFGLFGAQASVKLYCFEIAYKAELVLVGGSVSIFELQIAIGLNSKIGYNPKTHSVEVEYLGTGITLGGSTGFCVLSSCFKVNIFKIFGRSQQGSRMLPCQGQCPEVRVEVLEKQCTTVPGKNETACEWVWTPSDNKALIG